MKRLSRRLRPELVAVVILAFVVRLAWIRWGVWVGGDAPEYSALAHSIAANGVFGYDGHTPSTARPPLYPAVIALTLLLHVPSAIYLIQAIVGSATVAVIYGLVNSTFGRRCAAMASLALALAPMTARYSAIAVAETLFTFLVVLAMWAWANGFARACGVALGLSVLTRAVLLPYVLLMGLLWLIPRLRPYIPGAGAIVALALLVVAPWVARNVAVSGRATVADAGWGVGLLNGTVVLHTGSNPVTQLYREFGGFPGASSTETALMQRALERIRAAPGAWIAARLSQYPRLFIDSGDYLPVDANRIGIGEAWAHGRFSTIALKVAFVGGNLLILVLAGLGVWKSRADLSRLVPLWSVLLYVALAQLPIYVEPRYGLPAMPFLLVWGSALFRPVPIESARGAHAAAPIG